MKHCGWRTLLAGSFGLCLLIASVQAASSLAIREIRLWAGPDATRLVFDLSSPTTHRLQTLQNPNRVVLDIPSGRITGARRALPEGQGFIKQLRASPQANGDLRFVIELAAPATPRVFLVEPSGNYGHRLVVDLEPATKAAPQVVKSTHDGPGRDVIVAIDAGHGGTDPGASGRSGTREKDITLAIARRLKERIDREPGMRAVLTREGDYFLAHRVRIKRARDQQASMFVSVHADAYRDRSAAGSSVYVLSQKGASDEAARWLAERENAADLLGGVSLEDKDDVLASVLLDLSQSASMSASIEAAENVLHELYSVGNIKRRTVQHARFLVLKSPDIPSMLVETAFISNPSEELRLKDPRHQQRLADAIHAGVRAYFYANPPPGSRIAELRDQAASGVVASNAAPEATGSAAAITP
jgi:N-acetylmuramoyl-L-alanine amidase